MKILLMKIFLPWTLFLIGCSAEYVPVSPSLPIYIKRLHLDDIKTDIDFYERDEFLNRFKVTLEGRFFEDRRIAITDEEEANAILASNIKRYIVTPVKRSATNVVLEYVVWVRVDIFLYNRINKELLWEELRLEAKSSFSPNSIDFLMLTTETEAQDVIISKLSDIIVSRTIDGWIESKGVDKRK